MKFPSQDELIYSIINYHFGKIRLPFPNISIALLTISSIKQCHAQVKHSSAIP